jgi:hypothetical protein
LLTCLQPYPIVAGFVYECQNKGNAGVGPGPDNLARGDGRNNSVVQQNRAEATADMPDIGFSDGSFDRSCAGARPAPAKAPRFAPSFISAIEFTDRASRS